MDLVLPPLREDLQLMPGAAADDGSPTWLLYDPVRHRHFRLTLEAFELLRLWPQAVGRDLQALTHLARDAGVPTDDQRAQELWGFLSTQQLVQARDAADRQRLQSLHEATRMAWWQWLVHHYLFIRIPLWRPDAFLQRAMSWVEPLFDRRMAWALRAMGLVGIVMVLQQWTAFSQTFVHFFSWDGLAWYGLALLFVKSLHELGHAFTARRLGCRVTSIGVALMVGMPVLYTDTSDAWRLRRNRDRLQIVTAGLRIELYVAGLSTLAWAFLPEGPMRSAAFFLATTSWVSSVAINLSPFMRFDGYFALSDAWGVENLQPRSFALARWQLREWLFDLQAPPPEPLPHHRRRLMVAYAFATWLYRLVLFTGIALMVYHFTFKVLGVILFLVEILWFIVMPIYKEVRPWWQARHRLLARPRTRWTLAGLAMLILLAAMPWQPTVRMPAMLEAGGFQQVFPPEAGQVAEILVRPSERVEAGQLLVRLDQPSLTQDITQVEEQLALVQTQEGRRAGSERDLRDSPVLAQRAAQLRTRLQALRERQAQLAVQAPVAGRVSQVQSLRVGQWVARDTPLASVRADQGVRVIALVNEADLPRVQAGARGLWISDFGLRAPLDLQVVRIDEAAVSVLPYPELASDHGGPIAARALSPGQLRPEQALYRVELTPLEPTAAPSQREPGQLHVQAPARSPLLDSLRHLAAVLIKESGF